MFDALKELIEDIEQYLASHPLAGYFAFKILDITGTRLWKSTKRLSVKVWKQLLIYIKQFKTYLKDKLKKHFK